MDQPVSLSITMETIFLIVVLLIYAIVLAKFARTNKWMAIALILASYLVIAMADVSSWTRHITGASTSTPSTGTSAGTSSTVPSGASSSAPEASSMKNRSTLIHRDNARDIPAELMRPAEHDEEEWRRRIHEDYVEPQHIKPAAYWDDENINKIMGSRYYYHKFGVDRTVNPDIIDITTPYDPINPNGSVETLDIRAIQNMPSADDRMMLRSLEQGKRAKQSQQIHQNKTSDTVKRWITEELDETEKRHHEWWGF
jgi:hypothetical protein